MSQSAKLFIFFEIVFFAIIILFTIQPVQNYDFWFHIANGRYIFEHHTIPTTDMFSYTAYGQPAISYEWFFQFIAYVLYHFLGTIPIQILVVTLTLSYLLLFRQILVEIFQVSIIPRVILIGGLFAIDYSFWVERPQLVGYLCFMLILYVVLKKVFLNKNWLWMTPIIFWVWTNSHASMILGLYLFFSFSGMLFLKWLGTKEKKDLRDSLLLLAWGLVNVVITILPPLYLKVYELLWIFFEKRNFIAKAIDEWIPLTQLGPRYYIYLGIFALMGVSLMWAFLKSTKKSYFLLFLPFIPLTFFVLSGVRHTAFTMPATFLLCIPFLNTYKMKVKQPLQILILLVSITLLTYLFYLYRQQVPDVQRDYPTHAIPFIKENLKGNMFNEFEIGGYLIYTLEPTYKTFIDGRTDMFLPVVLPEYIRLLGDGGKYYQDSSFISYFNFLVKKYDISWVIIKPDRYDILGRLHRILRDDTHWHKVFFDDTVVIYVRDDGKNTPVIKKFAIDAATPFGQALYRPNQRLEAIQDYIAMYRRVPSAAAANALGYFSLQDKQYDKAKTYFNQALLLNPTAAAPKENLAELAVMDGNYNKAMQLYRQAIQDDPQRGLPYLRLGQIIIQSGASQQDARDIWQQGIDNALDPTIVSQLKKLLQQ